MQLDEPVLAVAIADDLLLVDLQFDARLLEVVLEHQALLDLVLVDGRRAHEHVVDLAHAVEEEHRRVGHGRGRVRITVSLAYLTLSHQ